MKPGKALCYRFLFATLVACEQALWSRMGPKERGWGKGKRRGERKRGRACWQRIEAAIPPPFN